MASRVERFFLVVVSGCLGLVVACDFLWLLELSGCLWLHVDAHGWLTGRLWSPVVSGLVACACLWLLVWVVACGCLWLSVDACFV